VASTRRRAIRNVATTVSADIGTGGGSPSFPKLLFDFSARVLLASLLFVAVGECLQHSRRARPAIPERRCIAAIALGENALLPATLPVLPLAFQFLAAWVEVWVASHQADQLKYLKTVNRASPVLANHDFGFDERESVKNPQRRMQSARHGYFRLAAVVLSFSTNVSRLAAVAAPGWEPSELLLG
jgi:hypothetical protein